MSKVRYDVSFTGRVQGVFFRATAMDLARDFQVTGWVRNEPDGSVRLAAEGDPAELDRFLEAIRRAKGPNIRDVTVDRTEATDEFVAFEIRY